MEAENDPYWRRAAEESWVVQFAGEVGDHLDPAVATADLLRLRNDSEKVRRYVDQNVAHLDARTLSGVSLMPR